MTMNDRLDEGTARAHAFAGLDQFCTRYLPGTLRRIMVWKRLPSRTLRDLADEVRQELAVDCLENLWQIVAQPTATLHLRWMRLSERYIYRTWVTHLSHTPVPEDLPARAEASIVPELPAMLLDRMTPFERMQNGRLNHMLAARRLGQSQRAFRRHLGRLAERLGHDNEHHAFWRQRLVEALVGLASDLLRDTGTLHLLPRARTRPDPDARRRRLRRLGGRFAIRPTTQHERGLLCHWLRHRQLQQARPRLLLEQAVDLAPHARSAWLWLFEACLVDGDLPAAATALRACRSMAAPSVVASTLARARLAEAHRGLGKAARVLAGAVARWPRLTELERVLGAVRAQVEYLATRSAEVAPLSDARAPHRQACARRPDRRARARTTPSPAAAPACPAAP